MALFPVSWQRARNVFLTASIVTLVILLLSACGADPQTQQKATIDKTNLDTLIAHAQSIGVPDTMLTPILQQETQISNTNAPITVFNGQPATDYYSNLAQRYQLLAL